MPTEPKYPRFHQAIVGLTPAKMKIFSPEDMEALVCAFDELTSLDPLAETRGPAALFESYRLRKKWDDESN